MGIPTMGDVIHNEYTQNRESHIGYVYFRNTHCGWLHYECTHNGYTHNGIFMMDEITES